MSNEPNIFEDFQESAEVESGLNFNQDGAAKVNTPRPLFNGRQPAYVLQAERPEHRLIIMLKAAGHMNTEIAHLLEISPVTVGTVVKQEWARKQILEEIEKSGREPILQLMQIDAMEAYERLRLLSETAESEEVKRKANESILDRVLGKASQPITITNKPVEEMSLEEINQRIATLKSRATN